MHLTSFTDYSIRTLMYLLVHKERRCTVKEITKGFDLSNNHMVKVVNNLVRLGYVESTKGKNGGIKLAKSAEKIRLGTLVMQLEPNFHLTECFDKKDNTCKILSVCELKFILNKALEYFLRTLEEYTLSDTITNSQKFNNLVNKNIIRSSL